MNEPDTKQDQEPAELEATTIEEVAGGADLCSPEQYRAISESLTDVYENVVGFASHVIGRVAGES